MPAWLLLGALPLLLGRALLPLVPPETGANPRRLIAAIPPALRTQPVFNDYTFGGPLILAGIRPYIDGRADMYGDAFVVDYAKALKGDFGRFERAVDRYGIRWTILPTDGVLTRQVESSGKWRRIYGDAVGVIDVRTDRK